MQINAKPIIGVDIDDVLWDLVAAWLNRHNEINDDNVVPEDIKSWNIYQYITKGSKDMFFYILEQSDFWETVKPKEGAQHYLKSLVDEGYDIYIITASNYKTVHKKIDKFLELFPFIRKDQIIISYKKGLIDVDVMIDDNPANLCDFNDEVYKIIFDAPHNRWCNESGINATRCVNWEEVYSYIKNI